MQRVCNNRQCCNDDKFRCECKELIEKGVCNKGAVWKSRNCECDCDKSCGVDIYLDHKNCKCRKKLVDELLQERTKNFEGVKIAEITLTECKSV